MNRLSPRYRIAGLLGALLATAGAAAAETGLVAYYPLDQGQGAVARDVSGNDYSGTIHGALWRTGPSGTSLLLDGKDDWIDCGTDAGGRIDGAGTVAVWVRPAAARGGLITWSSGTALPDQRFALRLYSSGTAQVLGLCLADGATCQQAYEGAAPPLNVWTHLTVTFDGTAVTVYRDGVGVHGATQTVTPKLADVPLWLGRGQGLAQEPFSGQLSEARVYQRAISASEAAAIYEGGRQRFKRASARNSLCWDLLAEAPDGPPAAAYRFYNPRWRGGWVYLRSEGDDTLALSLPAASPPTVRAPGGGTAQEAMRWLATGDHVIEASGNGTLKSLIVRSIPELHYSQYLRNPWVNAYEPYDWDFLDRIGMWSAVNTIMAHDTAAYNDRAAEWRAQGKAWICHAGRPVDDATACYNYWARNQGYQNPLMRGVISDEYSSGWVSQSQFDHYTEAVRMLHDTPGFAGKWFIPYVAETSISDGMKRFVGKCVDLGYAFALERYPSEPRTEAAAASAIQGGYAMAAGEWDAAVPNSVQRLIMVPGFFSTPKVSLNVNPNVDFKVFMDMTMHRMATASQCVGLYGIQWYISAYTDEENLRFAATLLRHYAIEGRTTRLNSDPYLLEHVLDGDFENGTASWAIAPAENGSMEVRTADTYSWIQGRYPQTAQGDTFLWTRRSAAAPNVFSQPIRALQPGREYSLKLITGDYGDWEAGVSADKAHDVTITLTGGVIRQATTARVVSGNSNDRFSGSKGFWMNYHWRVFQATESTGGLEISDWPAAGGPGDFAGQELMFNFIELQPYWPLDNTPPPTLVPTPTVTPTATNTPRQRTPTPLPGSTQGSQLQAW